MTARIFFEVLAACHSLNTFMIGIISIPELSEFADLPESVRRAAAEGKDLIKERQKKYVEYERAVELKAGLEKLLDEGDKKIRILTETGEEELDAEEIR